MTKDGVKVTQVGKVSALHIYLVKSMAVTTLKQVTCTDMGFYMAEEKMRDR